MGKLIDLTGEKFGRLTVIEQAPRKDKKIMWRCKCNCGNDEDVIVWSVDLRQNNKLSCGCLLEEYRDNCRDELIGQRFGKLTVIEWIPVNERTDPRKVYRCKCDCGNLFEVRKDLLKEGRRKSCGCSQNNNKPTKHGLTDHRLYTIWHKIKTRCYLTTAHEYPNYGGRGITMCDEWVDDFKAFYDWSMANGYEYNLTIDRIDVNGNYEPTNCRWITNLEQQNNRRDNIYIYDENDNKYTATELGRMYNTKPQKIREWIKKGLSYNQITEKLNNLK